MSCKKCCLWPVVSLPLELSSYEKVQKSFRGINVAIDWIHLQMIHNDLVCFFLFCFALLLIVGVVDLRHVGHALLKGLSNSSLPKLLGTVSGVIDEDNELLICPLLIGILPLSHCDKGWRCHIFS